MGVTVPGWSTGGLLAKTSRVARLEDMVGWGRTGDESESEESVVQARRVATGWGLVGDAVREVRGEVGGILLLVLSGVGVVGLRDSLGKKEKKVVRCRWLCDDVASQRCTEGVGRGRGVGRCVGNPEGVTRPVTEAI
jgi:hypothetical protein